MVDGKRRAGRWMVDGKRRVKKWIVDKRRRMARGGWWKEVERVIRTLCKFPTLVIFNLFRVYIVGFCFKKYNSVSAFTSPSCDSIEMEDCLFGSCF